MARDSIIEEVPQPPPGRLPFLLLIARLLSNPLASWGRDFYQQPLVGYRSFGRDTVFVMEPELIQQVLLDDADSFTKSPVHDQVLGEGAGQGLLIAEDELWRWQRRSLAPLFRADDVAAYVPDFVSACGAVLERWASAPHGSLQPIDDDMAAATLHVLEDTVLGAGLSREDHARVGAAATTFLQPTVWKIAFASLGLPPWTPHPGYLRMSRASRDLRDVASRALARRRAADGAGDDLLGRLITAHDPASGEPMPERLIVDNIVTFLLAGHETTAQALSWTLYLLSLFPEWQDRARNEVRRVAGGRPIGREEVQNLPLLEAIFQESMRLYPPAPSLVRIARNGTSLGGYPVAASASIVIPIYVVHRHERLWDEPLRFDPARFSPEAKIGRHRCAYMPFGAGPRTCIGSTFAMLEGKTMLATLLAKAKFELPEKEVPEPLARITLRPRAGLKLNVTMLGED
jgi:cytochrome P450